MNYGSGFGPLLFIQNNSWKRFNILKYFLLFCLGFVGGEPHGLHSLKLLIMTHVYSLHDTVKAKSEFLGPVLHLYVLKNVIF
jgi:hypothetical protein